MLYTLIECLQVHADSDVSLSFGHHHHTAHHSVASSTGEITPKFSILCNSALTWSLKASGIRLGVFRAKGTASFLRLISYGFPKFPSPVNNFGYDSMIVLRTSDTASRRAMICNSVIAGSPNKLRVMLTWLAWSITVIRATRAGLNTLSGGKQVLELPLTTAAYKITKLICIYNTCTYVHTTVNFSKSIQASEL